MKHNWLYRSLAIGLALIALALTSQAIAQAASGSASDRIAAPRVFDSPMPMTATVEFTGVVQAIGPLTWTIGTRDVAISAHTEIDHGIQVGAEVKVKALVQSDGTLLAREIKRLRPRSIVFVGVAQTILSDTWTIDSQTVHVDSHTRIQGDIYVGDSVRVTALQQTDGSLLARAIKLVTKHVKFTGVVKAMGPVTWTVGSRAVTIDTHTRIDSGIQVSDSVKVIARRQTDGSLLALTIKLVKHHVERVKFSGAIEAMTVTAWTIGGRSVSIDAHTQITGSFKVGDVVKVQAIRQPDGSLLATRIELAHGSGQGNH
jgi:hypothetical protein